MKFHTLTGLIAAGALTVAAAPAAEPLDIDKRDVCAEGTWNKAWDAIPWSEPYFENGQYKGGSGLFAYTPASEGVAGHLYVTNNSPPGTPDLVIQFRYQSYFYVITHPASSSCDVNLPYNAIDQFRTHIGK